MEKNIRFDWHTWNAITFRRAEEIEIFLNENKIYEKTILSVNVIGMTESDPKSTNALIPCEISICEPVVIEFSDNSTLEMQIYPDDSIKLSVNQIPANLTDGINFSNIDADKLFSKLKGASIRGIHLIKKTIESHNGKSSYTEVSVFTKLQFDVSGEYGFYIENNYDNWYNLALCKTYHAGDFGDKTALITTDAFKKALKPKHQIEIIEGHDCSSYFWIMPVKLISKHEEWDIDVEEYRDEEISIDEIYVYSFLYYFLEQYFDSSIQEPFRDTRIETLDFLWNLEYNVFTYDSIRNMLKKIREYSHLLKTDFDNPALNELKKRFSPSDFDNEYFRYKNPPGEEETIRNNIYVATEFYERFCDRMESMMAYAPQFDLISFMGP